MANSKGTAGRQRRGSAGKAVEVISDSRSAQPTGDKELRDFVDNMPGFVFRRELAPDGTVTYPYISPLIRERYDIDPAEEGRAKRLLDEHSRSEDRQFCLDAARSAEKWLRIVSYVRKLANGDIQWDCIALDTTEDKALEAHLLDRDLLTGLPNRALLVTWLTHALGRAGQLDSPAFVIALELLSLTGIRESAGFEAGDACILEAAKRVQSAVRFADTVAYTGGGGFLIVLAQVDNMTDFTAPLRAIMRQFEARFHLGDEDFPLNISMGVCVIPDDGDEAETLIGHATTALNKAKEDAARPYRFYNSKMTERAVHRLGIDSELRRAIEKNELVLFYQPQYDSQTLQLVGVEALMRWQHPVRGLVMPGEFISVAEETGLIVPLGDFALREACAQAQDWQRRGLTDVPVSVNLSGVQLREKGLGDRILDILSETGLAPSRLKLELTESMIVNDPDSTANMMRYLADAGVEFAVDDFGIEHSALSHLSRLPIKALKIDYSFVSKMTENHVHAALVQAIISMAHSMGMSVVAEGVETQSQLTYLQAYQCDSLQGFLLNRPMPAGELETILKNQTPKERKADLLPMHSHS